MEYYRNLEGSLRIIDLAIVDLERSMTDEYDTTNYSKTLCDLNNTRRAILKMLAVHKFMRMSKEIFIKQTLGSGQMQESIHIVKQYETPVGIALKYNMSLEDLLRKNNVTTTEIEAGMTLRVNVNQEAFTKIYEEIPTFGSQEGLLVLGKDVSNNLQCDDIGDLNILTPGETVAQGILNRLTCKAGSYIFEENFGVRNDNSGDLPTELSEEMFLQEVKSQLKFDNRIVEIENLLSVKEQTTLKVRGLFTAINNVLIEL